MLADSEYEMILKQQLQDAMELYNEAEVSSAFDCYRNTSERFAFKLELTLFSPPSRCSHAL